MNRPSLAEVVESINKHSGGSEMKALKPSTQLLCKLGSIAVHAQELASPDGHEFDRIALAALLQDAEVIAWLSDMDSAAFLPKKRTKQ